MTIKVQLDAGKYKLTCGISFSNLSARYSSACAQQVSNQYSSGNVEVNLVHTPPFLPWHESFCACIAVTTILKQTTN